MQNAYVSEILYAMQTVKEKTIMVFKNKLSVAEEEMVKTFAIENNKIIYLASLGNIIKEIDNKDKNTYIVK